MLQVIARSFMSLSLGKPIDNRSIDSPEDAFETTCFASCGTPDRWEDDAQGTLPPDCQRPCDLATHMPITRTAGMWQETPTCTSE